MSRSISPQSGITPASPRVVGSGLVALDVFLRKMRVPAWSALGGSAGNVLAVLAYLGWSSIPVARLGRDTAADRIRREFEELGADTRFLLCDPLSCTPVIYQLPGECDKTHRFSFVCPNCGQKRGFACSHGDDLSAPVLRDVATPSVFYFDRITPIALALAEAYRACGTLVMFEPSAVVEDTAGFSRAVRAAHVLKYADDRIADLAGYDLGHVDIEIQTLGARGLRFRAPSLVDAWVTLPAFEVPHIEDTAGAGDWCSAGMLYALFAGEGVVAVESLTHNRLFEALRFGQALAALNCMHQGARGLARRWAAQRVARTARALCRSQPALSSVGYRHQAAPRLFEWPSVTDSYLRSAKITEIPRLCCEPLHI